MFIELEASAFALIGCKQDLAKLARKEDENQKQLMVLSRDALSFGVSVMGLEGRSCGQSLPPRNSIGRRNAGQSGTISAIIVRTRQTPSVIRSAGRPLHDNRCEVPLSQDLSPRFSKSHDFSIHAYRTLNNFNVVFSVSFRLTLTLVDAGRVHTARRLPREGAHTS